MSRCKMNDLSVGDVFSFGSNERHTVREIRDGYLWCQYVDMGGVNVSNLKRVAIRDIWVECLDTGVIAQVPPTIESSIIAVGAVVPKVAAEPVAEVEADIESGSTEPEPVSAPVSKRSKKSASSSE